MLRMSWRPQHLRIVGACQHQRRLGLLRVGRAFEQQPGGGDVADRKQALRPLQQRRKFIRIDAPCRNGLAGWRYGLADGRHNRGGLAGGFARHRLGHDDLALDRALIGGGNFVA